MHLLVMTCHDGDHFSSVNDLNGISGLDASEVIAEMSPELSDADVKYGDSHNVSRVEGFAVVDYQLEYIPPLDHFMLWNDPRDLYFSVFSASARSYSICRPSQTSGRLPNAFESLIASSGEGPDFPFRTLFKFSRVTPRRAAALVTVMPSGSMQSCLRLLPG